MVGRVLAYSGDQAVDALAEQLAGEPFQQVLRDPLDSGVRPVGATVVRVRRDVAGPGGAARPSDQKIVAALNTWLPLAPGYTVAV